MKKIIMSIIAFLLLALIVGAGVAGAQNFRSGDNVTVGRGQVVNSTCGPPDEISISPAPSVATSSVPVRQ